MPKITSTQPQKKNPNRFNIFLDGKFAFGADEDLVVNFRLVLGKEILSEDLENILFEAEVGKLMEKMYGLFSIRQRSEREVKNYFRIKNYQAKVKDKEEISELVIESLIQKLKDKGLLNDLEFARAWVDARRKSKLKGNQAIKAELLQKGIAKETIDEALRDQAVDEIQLATSALERKLKAWQNLSELDFKKKAYGLLARRGFDYSVISVVVANHLKKG